MGTKAIVAVCFGYVGGIWFLILALRRWGLARRARSWPSTQGKILESTLYKDAGGKGTTHFRVRYEFSVGRRVESSTPRIAGDWFWTDAQQAAFVSRYAAGQPVEVFYDPADPSKNCLERGDLSGVVVMWVIAVAGMAWASAILWYQLKGGA